MSASVRGTRRDVAPANGALTERSLAIAEVVGSIASEIGKTPAQVAIAWTLLNPAVTAPILGARTLAPLEDNLGALEVELSLDQRAPRRGEPNRAGLSARILAAAHGPGLLFGETQVELRRRR